MTSDCAFSYDQLLEYTDTETQRWSVWLASNPAALDVPFADGQLATVRRSAQQDFPDSGATTCY